MSRDEEEAKRHHDNATEREIVIKESKSADTRSCDVAKVSENELLMSSYQHIGDVQEGIQYFQILLSYAAAWHDFDKVTDEGVSAFYSDFKTSFEKTGWWDNHRKVNRHHLLQDDGVPEDVNLVDVIEMIVDCVMAGMARKGEVYLLDIPDDVLRKAFDNTAKLLQDHVRVEGDA